jgi:signal transduction histidine kinase
VRIGVEVRDTGIGIPADRQQAIFGSYSQAGSATSRQFGGTGLGLAISREIVERMQGTIGFDTESGVGTTFRVEFPQWPAPDAGAVPEAAGRRPRAARRAPAPQRSPVG